MNEPRVEFETLMAALSDGSADQGQKKRLAQMLSTEAAWRAEYVRQMRMETLLTFAMGAAVGTPKAAVPRPKMVRFTMSRVAAAAAAIALASALYWALMPQRVPASARSLARELPPLVEAGPGSLFADVLPPREGGSATDFLLPFYLQIQMP